MIRIEISSYEPQEKIDYPCLMISKKGDAIVYFVKERCGLVLSKESDTPVRLATIINSGEYVECFYMSDFIPFNKTIIISNRGDK